MKERLPAIIGVGKAVGREIVNNERIAHDLGRDPEVIKRLMGPVGIIQRHWVVRGEQATSDLSVEAIYDALAMAGISKETLKAIVIGTSSADYLALPAASIVQDKLGLPHTVRGYDISAACTGWVHALYEVFNDLQSRLGQGGPQVAVGAEVISPTLSTKKPLVYPLFGDAAGATIVDNVEPDDYAPREMAFAFGSDGQFARKLFVPAGGSKHPATHETVERDMHTPHMDGKLIAEQAALRMAEFTREALKKAGVHQKDVALFIPHQANLAIMEDVADRLEFPIAKMMITVDRYGNTSAASIPTALREAWDTGRIKRNDILAFATFGAGLTFAAGVIPMVGLPRRK